MSDTFLDLRSNAGALAANVRIGGVQLGKAQRAFSEISEILKASVQGTLLKQAFPALRASTVEVKARRGESPKILFSGIGKYTGLFRWITRSYGPGFGAAMRGRDQYYGFMHNEGKGGAGYSRRVTSAFGHKLKKPVRATVQPFTFLKREFMVITPDARERTLETYREFIQTTLDDIGGADGAA